MSAATLRIVITLVLGFHGIGQLMGIIPMLKLPILENASNSLFQGWNSHSWILSNSLGDGPARILGGILFGLAFLGFATAVFALMDWMIPHVYWKKIAFVSALLSMLALLLYWNALMLLFPHKIGNILVNAVVILSVWILEWPTEADLGF